MLDTETKRRIDTARDILVGKVPDPKSQVEQITIALIYKFMDDMDAEAEELGGKRKFFAGEFARYGWAKLMRSGMGGHEVLNLYAEGIGKMPENPGIPLLFRNIFKNAYLPYRDPETLKMFLKVIDEFTYDHSERLGDAFEYLLSVLGSQGDAGQFRTPRHIIDFIVKVVDPKKTETVLDPACGTAGFLISSYKHILAANRKNMDRQDGQDEAEKEGKKKGAGTAKPGGGGKAFISCESSASMLTNMDRQDGQDKAEKEGKKKGAGTGKPDGGGNAFISCESSPSMFTSLTPDEKGRLARNFKGYDISPDMVRLSLVNLYLHGFTDPHIFEYDTLTSQDRWNEYADVILANPPFMSPKGGIKPHNRFSVQSKRSEVLFVDYMAEHLTPTGRAGIIVPEGIIFQSQNAYTQLRKLLVDEYLVAVVSLPAGVFNPYSGVKTSILILDKSLAKRSNTIGFFKVENDGFGLGAQRREIDKNDLPQVQAEIAEYLRRVRAGKSMEDLQSTLGLIVPKEKIGANGDYNLSGERYREIGSTSAFFPRVRLGQACERIMDGTHFSPKSSEKGECRYITAKNVKEWGLDLRDVTYLSKMDHDEIFRRCPVRKGDVLYIKDGATTGIATINPLEEEFSLLSSVAVLRGKEGLLENRFLAALLNSPRGKKYMLGMVSGVAITRLTLTKINDAEIPLPPLEVQKEIVAEIEGYRKVIDGARAVLDNYRPHIPIHPDWPTVGIGTISTIVRGSSPRPQGDPKFFGGPVPRLMVADITRDGMYATPRIDSLTEEGATKSRPMKKGDVVITVSGNPGLPTILAVDACIHDGFVGLRELNKNVRPEYLYFALLALHATHGSQSVGAVFKNLTTDQIREFKIALPPVTTQQAIVAEIEAEQALVDANRELIVRFEKKIQATLARVWGEELSSDDQPADSENTA